MRQITITGNLAADAEVKMSKQGNAYLQFRMANNEYNEDKPHWYNITSNIPYFVNLSKYYKKGSSVIVTGDYSDEIYQTKTGSCEISRNIRAVAIHFNSNGRSSSEEGKATTSESTTPSAKVGVSEVKMGEFKPATTKMSTNPSVTVTDEDDDDLPF